MPRRAAARTASLDGAEPPLLVFDGDCAFCTSARDWMADRVAFASVPYQWADLAQLGLTREEASRRIHVVGPGVTGGHLTGGRAAAWLLRQSSRARWRVAGALLGAPVLRWGTELVYRLIAANRHRLPGATPACAMPRD